MRTSGPDFEKRTLNAYMIQPNEIRPGDRFGYKVIVMIYPDAIWTAYRGPTGWPDQRVAEEGDVIDEAAAKLLFPTIAANYIYYRW